MAVLAVFLLLALAGAQACEEQQQGTPGAPTPTSTPAAAAAAAAATTTTTTTATTATTATTTTTTTTTEEPPTTESLADLPPIPRQRFEEETDREPSLYIYALLNAARLRGRTNIHGLGGECEDGDSEGCSCPLKLYDDAMCYQRYGAVERWCDLAPEDNWDLEPDEDGADFLTCQEDHSVSQVAREQSTIYDQLKCTEAMPSVSLLASPTITQFSSRQAQPIPVQSPSRPVSSVICEPAPQDLSLRKRTSQSVIEQWVEDTEMLHPPQPVSPISDIQPEDSVCEGNDQTMNSVCQDHNYHSVWTRREIDAAYSLASMLTSEETIQDVNVQSDPEPVPMDEISDVPDEPVEDDGDMSDGSLVEVGSVGSNVARAGTSSSPSDESEDVLTITPEEPMDVDTDNTGPDAMEMDIKMEVESSAPDIAAEVEVRTPVEQTEEAVTDRWEGERTVEQASRLQLPVPTPEPRPGPSGVWRPPSQSSPSPSPLPPPNISLPDFPGTRYSRRRESVIYYARGYPGSEILGPVNPLEWMPQPPANIKEELNRIFGLPEDEPPTLEQPEQYNCPGELKVAMLGTNVLPMFTVYVVCDKDPKNCQPPTVCSPVVTSIPVSKRKNVPFDKQVFTLIGDPHDEWEPGILRLSTACFCAPPNYKSRAMQILNVPAPP